jgi:hypothetical protein
MERFHRGANNHEHNKKGYLETITEFLKDSFHKYKKGIYSVALFLMISFVIKRKVYDKMLPISDAIHLMKAQNFKKV